jgi:hypothetical protein
MAWMMLVVLSAHTVLDARLSREPIVDTTASRRRA